MVVNPSRATLLDFMILCEGRPRFTSFPLKHLFILLPDCVGLYYHAIILGRKNKKETCTLVFACEMYR